MPLDKEKVLEGRKAVDKYRADHAKLYEKPWHKEVPEEHTPLLEQMKADLRKQGFNSLDEFFAASEELNAQELGFKDRADFEKRATERDREALDRMWH